jgi:hypothetical protein
VGDQVSYPYSTASKITVLYILILRFFDIRWEDKRFWIEWKQAFPEFNLFLTSSWM